MSPAPKSADIPARFAVLGVLAALGFAYYLGNERAGEVRFAVESVRAHESKLVEHERRIAASEATLGVHEKAISTAATRIDGHDAAIAAEAQARKAAEAKLDGLRTEVARLARELGEVKGDLERRDADMSSLLERVARLERALAAQAER